MRAQLPLLCLVCYNMYFYTWKLDSWLDVLLKTTEQQLEKIQKEYESLMTGTRQKFDQFQQHIDQLEKENKELNKNLDEQRQ